MEEKAIKIKEMIEKLQTLDPEMEVFTTDYEGWPMEVDEDSFELKEVYSNHRGLIGTVAFWYQRETLNNIRKALIIN